MSNNDHIHLGVGDALLIVDMQNDFLPGGSLAVVEGDQIIPILNRYLDTFHNRGLPIVATRDWHPAHHCSFQAQGGIWQPHCVAGTAGAQFADDLALPEGVHIVSKAYSEEKDAYSGFDGTTLAQWLRDKNVSRVFVGGLATDYCVLNTVKDALGHGFKTFLLQDAIKAVNVQPGDGARAEKQMLDAGAEPINHDKLKV